MLGRAHFHSSPFNSTSNLSLTNKLADHKLSPVTEVFNRKLDSDDPADTSCRSEESLTGNSSFSGSSTTPDGHFEKLKILAGKNGKILSLAPKIEIHSADVNDDDEVFDGINGFGQLAFKKRKSLGNEKFLLLIHSNTV